MNQDLLNSLLKLRDSLNDGWDFLSSHDREKVDILISNMYDEVKVGKFKKTTYDFALATSRHAIDVWPIKDPHRQSLSECIYKYRKLADRFTEEKEFGEH